QAHPGVEVIARDRGVMYVDGATWGAPGAIHVVDRRPMARNLGEALERLFACKHDALAVVARETASQYPIPPPGITRTGAEPIYRGQRHHPLKALRFHRLCVSAAVCAARAGDDRQ